MMAEPYIRSKKKFAKRNQSGSYTTWDFPGPSVTVGNSFSQFFDYSYTLTGEKNPHWRDQIRHLGNATTNMTASGCADPSGDLQCLLFLSRRYTQNNQLVATRFGTLLGHLTVEPAPTTVAPDSSVITRVDNRSLRKFLDNIESVQSSLEAGQDLGEYKETLHSIHRPLGSLQDGMINYLEKLRKLKSRRRNRPSLKKILTDTYLEFHFGWQPLANDVASLIADAGRYRFPTYRVYGAAHERYAQSGQTVSRNADPLPNSYSYGVQTTHEYSVRRMGVVKSNSAASGKISWAQSLQLTPKDWLPTAWDLLPYSWIADYFTNIGEMLHGLAHIFTDLVWGCRVQRTYSENQISDVSYGPVGHVLPPYKDVTEPYASGWGGKHKSARFTIVRSRIGEGDLVPKFEFRIPTGKYPYINIAALLLQRSVPLVPFFTKR